MPPSLELDVVGDRGAILGKLRIQGLVRARRQGDVALLLDMRGDDAIEPGVEPVQLLEGQEYVYQLTIYGDLGPGDIISTNKPELFFPDPDLSHRGRIRTGLYTGSVRVEFYGSDRRLGCISFEVRSSKLDYLQSYRWMLRDIAETVSELIMDRFAASEQAFQIDEIRDAETLYQRFAFLRCLIDSDDFEASIHHILSRPHLAWEEVDLLLPPGRGGRPSSRLSRSLVGPGEHVAWTNVPDSSVLKTLPLVLSTSRTESTLDNVPNRFVKFALERWRAVVADIGEALSAERPSAPVARGGREVDALLARLDAILSEELFREVGAMTYFPAGNQTLQKQEGYRHILAIYAQFELAAKLSWPGMEDVHSAGQRDVARLYEYWVYIQLGKAIASFCGGRFDATDLVQSRTDGLILQLRTGAHMALSGSCDRSGRKLRLELWFNRAFNSSGSRSASWTRPLRPDCSLLIRPDEGAISFDPVWIHFDAKYRIETAVQIFGDDAAMADDDGGARNADRPDWKREDLLKMHAYKDAIRRSVGAYVIYPGEKQMEPFREYHELLPGLGAFALRPSAAGEADGAAGIMKFIDDVIDHVALQVTQHERARFWQNQAYSVDARSQGSVAAAAFLDSPPADVLVLLGYAKSEAHRTWIARTQLYNLRADQARGGAVGVDGRELKAHLLVVYGEQEQGAADLYRIVGVPCLLTAARLVELAYPSPRGEHYLCLPIEKLPDHERPDWLDGGRILLVRRQAAPSTAVGAPVVTTWLQLCLGIGQ